MSDERTCMQNELTTDQPSQTSDDLAAEIVGVVVSRLGWPSDKDCVFPESVINLSMSKAWSRLVGPYRLPSASGSS